MVKTLKLSEIGEFGLINLLTGQEKVIFNPGRVIRGVGDDAAVFRVDGSRLMLLTTDMLVEGIHFSLAYSSFEQVGAKAMTANISDIAAMGGLPTQAVVSLGVPPGYRVEDLQALYRGLVGVAQEFGVNIVGGDTVQSPERLIINVALTGEVEEERVLFRSGARPGDLVLVTGDLGRPAAGLYLFKNPHGLQGGPSRGWVRETGEPGPDSGWGAPGANRITASGRAPRKPGLVTGPGPGSGKPDPVMGQGPWDGQGATLKGESLEVLKGAHTFPRARLKESRLLGQSGWLTSMNDISDGLASEIHEICQASGVGCRLWLEEIPVHPATREVAAWAGVGDLDWPLYGGEDFELVFTAPPQRVSELVALGEQHGFPVTVVGEIIGLSELAREGLAESGGHAKETGSLAKRPGEGPGEPESSRPRPGQILVWGVRPGAGPIPIRPGGYNHFK